MRAQEQGLEKTKVNVSVRPLKDDDIPAADRIYRLAFGTFLGLPDPMKFDGDSGIIKTRWIAEPTSSFGAEVNGNLVGSNFVTNWGSVGGFGPLSVLPNLWDQGIGAKLIEPAMELFEKWRIRHIGFFARAHSPKNIGLYQKFGFWPRFLTTIMSLPVKKEEPLSHVNLYSEVSDNKKEEQLEACREVTGSIYDGLDLEREIRAVNSQNLGDTLLLHDNSKVVGFAICHCGGGTEAGSGACYIKFGVVRPGSTTEQCFEQLLDACKSFASLRGMSRLVAGVNIGCNKAYRKMIERGFRTFIQGVAMHKPNESGFYRADVYLINDWR